MNKSAILLAAGRGSRLGNIPKCLISIDGELLLHRVLRAIANNNFDEIVVVLGHHHERIEPQLKGWGVRVVINPEPEEALTSSLRLGLAAVNSDTMMVGLADQALLAPTAVAELLSAWQHRPRDKSLLYPLVNEQRGNPVVFGQQVAKEVLKGASHFGVRQWQEAHAERVYDWPTQNQSYLNDIDSPEDVHQLARDFGLTIRLPDL